MATSTKRQHKILDLASRLHDKSDKGLQIKNGNNTKNTKQQIEQSTNDTQNRSRKTNTNKEDK